MRWLRIAVWLIAGPALAQTHVAITDHRGSLAYGLTDLKAFSLRIDGDVVEVPLADVIRIEPRRFPAWGRATLWRRNDEILTGEPTDSYFDCTTVNGAQRYHLNRLASIVVLTDFEASQRPTLAMQRATRLHWSFDDFEDEVADLSPHGNSGTVTGTHESVSGIHGSAIRLAPNAFVRCRDDASLDLSGSMTISLWCRPERWNGAGESGLCCKGKAGRESLAIVMHDSSFAFLRRRNAGATLVQVDANRPIRPGGWHHVVVMCDESKLSISVDGQRFDTKYEGTFDVNDEPLCFGARQSGSGAFDWGVGGEIDDVFVFDRALTPDEIDRLRRRGTPKRVAPMPRLLSAAGGLGLRDRFQAWIADGTLHERLTLDDAIDLLGLPTGGSSSRVAWYWNHRGRHVFPCLEATRRGHHLTGWTVVLR